MTMLDLFLKTLTAYQVRTSHAVRLLAIFLTLIEEGTGKTALLFAFQQYLARDSAARQALHALRFLKKAGYPKVFPPYVGPEAGAALRKILIDLVGVEDLLDMRPDGARIEMVIDR